MTPSISIANYELKAVLEFVYLGSAISESLSLETESNRGTGNGSRHCTLPAEKKSLVQKQTHQAH